MLRMSRDSTTLLLIMLIMALAAVLRVIGIGFGLPAVYNPDEVAIMSRALAFGTGDLNPHNFLYPTAYFYALFGWVGSYFAVARLTGIVESLAAFQDQFFVDPTAIYLTGRLLGVACGVATVGAVFLLGRRLFCAGVGLTAAFFLAVAPLHVRDSHYVKHDVPATLAIIAAYLAIMYAASQANLGGRTREILRAAAACGVAFSVHYYTVFLTLPLVLMILLVSAGKGPTIISKRLMAAGVTSLLCFFLLSPFLLVEPLTAWRDITANRQIVVDRAVEGTGTLFASSSYYLTALWRDTMGWPVVVLALCGLAIMLRRATRTTLLLLVFPVPFLAFIGNTVAASRYLNPVLPFVALFAAYGLWFLASRFTPRRRGYVIAMVAALTALPGAWESIRTGLFFRQPDTRTLALRFIERQVPAGSTILLQPYSAPVVQSRESLREALAVTLGDARLASPKFAIRLRLEPHPEPGFRTIFLGDGGLDADKIYVGYDALGGERGLGALQEIGVRYVVVKRYNRPEPSTLPFLAALEQHARRLVVFSPYRSGLPPEALLAVEPFLHNTNARIDKRLERPGPVVEIWQLNDSDANRS